MKWIVAVEAAALGLVAFGVWQIYPPASYIVTGVGALLWAQGGTK